MNAPRASVLIPTHNHSQTLPLTVASVLAQTVSDLEVIVIGDGVTDHIRAAAQRLVEADPRVRFLDLPKGDHHGERHRHAAIEVARSNAIFYLCDDDLLLPEHVSDLLDLLNRHNFVQCQNSYITPDGILRLLHSDLSNPEVVKWHVTERPFFNSTSLTGTAHARNFYIAVNHPWRPPHDGCPPDIYQWRRLMRHPDFSGATSSRVTALQLPTSMGREDSDQAERLAELEQWADLVRQPDAQARIDALVIQAAFDQLREASLSSERLRRSLRREWQRPTRRLVRWLRARRRQPGPPG